MKTLEILTVPTWFSKYEVPTRIEDLDIIAYLLRRNGYDSAEEACDSCMGAKKVTFEVTIKMKEENI